MQIAVWDANAGHSQQLATSAKEETLVGGQKGLVDIYQARNYHASRHVETEVDGRCEGHS